jgi:hypothetical protein
LRRVYRSSAFTLLAGIVVGGASLSGVEGWVTQSTIGVLSIALIGNSFNPAGVDPLYHRIVLSLILRLAVSVDGDHLHLPSHSPAYACDYVQPRRRSKTSPTRVAKTAKAINGTTISQVAGAS